ncbi:MAG: hypothetical protein Q8K82_17130 [Gemmatimonadaceae bacterium]|nr:hypothetical protein [Gemmatimonadaceae bacterium]
MAKDAPLLWVSSGGFHSDFAEAVRATHRCALFLTLEDLYREAR